jgi:hypothetical protein
MIAIDSSVAIAGFASWPERYLDLVGDLAQRHIVGGQVYDALIGLVAADHDVTLVSLDRRAVLVYEAVGAVVEQSV